MFTLVLDLFRSVGVKRGLSAAFAALAGLADFVPALVPFKQVFIDLAAIFGAAGLAHAGLAKAKK